MDADLLHECLELVDRLRELRAPRDIEEGSLMLNTCDYYALDTLVGALRARLVEPSARTRRLNGADIADARKQVFGDFPDLPSFPEDERVADILNARLAEPSAPAPAPSERCELERGFKVLWAKHGRAGEPTDEEVARELDISGVWANDVALRYEDKWRVALVRAVAAARERCQARARKEGT